MSWPSFALSDALLVSDLDGTLLDRNATLSGFTIETLNEFMAGGGRFTFATARSWTSASRLTRGLRVKLPVITYAGAVVVDPAAGAPFDVARLDATVVENVLAACRAGSAVQPIFFVLDRGRDQVCWHTSRMTSGVASFLHARPGDPRLLPLSNWSELQVSDVFYISLIGSRVELEELRLKLAELDELVHLVLAEDVYTSGEWWLEVTSSAGTKGHAVQRLKFSSGARHVIAFGDNLNDLPLFDSADFTVAVANALPMLLSAADALAGPNDADGVARWIRAVNGRPLPSRQWVESAKPPRPVG